MADSLLLEGLVMYQTMPPKQMFKYFAVGKSF